MASYPPPYPPPTPPYGGDPRFQKRVLRDQARAQREMIRAQRDMYRAQMRGMRRGSIVGPLLVVSVGLIFLLVQLGHIPGWQLWTWYGRWWPFLLIAIGLIRLGEWAFDQRSQRDLPPTAQRPRRTLGGGVVLLLAILASTGLVLSAVHNGGDNLFGHGFSLNQDNLDEFLGDKHESDQTVSHPCAPNASVSISNPRGEISVAGTSDDGQIHVAAHKEVFTSSDSEAVRKAEELSVKIDGSGTDLTVTMPTVEGGRADLTVTVPPTVTLAVTANRGDLRANSLRSGLTATANHGDIELSAITGPVTGHINNGDSSFAAHSVTGPLSIEGHGKDLTIGDISGPVALNGEFFGTTHLEHVQGPIRFHTSRTDFQLGRLDGEVEISPNADLSADQVAGPVTLNTRNRNITLERVSGDISVTNRNGSVDLTAAQPVGNIMVENRNGTVNVTMPSEAGFVVQADTTNGDLDNEFSLPMGGAENHPSLSGSVKGGGPLVRLSTTQGDLSLKKGTIAPMPPAPPAPPRLTPTPVAPIAPIGKLNSQATREAADELRAAQEQVRSANRDASEAQRDAQRKVTEAQRDAQRKLTEAQRQLKRAAEQEKQAPEKDDN